MYGSDLFFAGQLGESNISPARWLVPFDRRRSLVDDKIGVGEAGEDFKKLARTVLDAPKPAADKAAAKVKETVSKVISTTDWP